MQWVASPTSDMYADAVMKVILKAQELDTGGVTVPSISSALFDRMHFKVNPHFFSFTFLGYWQKVQFIATSYKIM